MAKRRRSKVAAEDSINLNLNPMLDIFSLLLAFLLMTYSTDPVNHDVHEDVELPDSETIVSLDELPAITASRTELKVNDLKVADIIGGDVPEEARTQGAIFPLYQELVRLAAANREVAAQSGVVREGDLSTITMEMDKGHHFRLMKRIMLSAQQAEFITFKLMVVKLTD